MRQVAKGDINAGIRYFRMKRYRQALAEFLNVMESAGENPEVSYYIGLCYCKLAELDNALIHLEQVVTNHDNILRIYQSRMVLSYIYAITGRFRLAQFELDKLIEAGYESPQVFSAYAYTAYAMKKVEESVGFLKKALGIDPDNANALNSLGYILAEENLELNSAVSYCESAVRKNPNNPSYLDSLGWAYYKLGNIYEARIQLRKALSLSGGDKIIAGHMRVVLAAE